MGAVVRSEDSAVGMVEFADAAAAAISRGVALRLESGDRACELRGDQARLVVDTVRAMGQGSMVEVSTLPVEITTGQAADLLGVSRPTVVSWVDKGLLPASRHGTHRRLRTRDVLEFRERGRDVRRDALDEIAAISEELGMYDT